MCQTRQCEPTDRMYFSSHAAIAPFTLHQPTSAHDAVQLMNDRPTAAFMGGGIDLVLGMRSGVAVSDVISLSRIPDLATVRAENGTLQIGGAVTFDTLRHSREADPAWRFLTDHLPNLGNIRVRCAGTLGGNLAARNPAYDLLPLLLAANAAVHIDTGNGATEWTMPAGLLDWAPGGLITRISVPAVAEPSLAFERRYKPVAAIAIGLWDTDTGIAGRLAVGCAFDRIWSADLPDGLSSRDDVRREAAGITATMTTGLPAPRDDTVASGAYRTRLIRTIAKRLLEASA